MDDSDGDWIVIAQPTPKKQSTPKQVPIFCARNAVSLQQPLKKGGQSCATFQQTCIPDSAGALSFFCKSTVGP